MIEENRRNREDGRVSLSFWAIVIAALALLAINVALQRRNSELEASLSDMEQSRGPQPGTVIPEIVGERPSGGQFTVRFGERTLVLVLSATCHICVENWPAWRQLISSLPKSTPVLFADVNDAVNERYMAKFAMSPERVVTKINLAAKWQYNLRETPETLVVAAGGKVEKTWIGKLNAADILDIRARF
jgi:hypothetical protein